MVIDSVQNGYQECYDPDDYELAGMPLVLLRRLLHLMRLNLQVELCYLIQHSTQMQLH